VSAKMPGKKRLGFRGHGVRLESLDCGFDQLYGAPMRFLDEINIAIAAVLGGKTLHTLSRGALLHNVRQLMSEQVPAALAVGRVFARAEYDIASHRVRACLYAPRSRRRPRVRMHAHSAEIAAEARLKIRSRGLRQSLTVALRGIDC